MVSLRMATLSFLILVAVHGYWLLFPETTFAQAETPGEPYTGVPICLPDAFLVLPADCLPLGPSETLSALARKGESYPPKPLLAARPPAEWLKSPVVVAKYNGDPIEPIYVYGSLDDAAAGINPVRTIPPGRGLYYVSYIYEARVEGKPYVQLKSGEWVRASPAGFSSFQGHLFSKTPTTSFGWVIDTIQARSAPSFTAPEVGDIIYRETPIKSLKLLKRRVWSGTGLRGTVGFHT